MTSRNIALIIACIVIYIALALFHAASKPEPEDKYAIIVEPGEQKPYEQKQVPAAEAEEIAAELILPVIPDKIQQQEPAPHPPVHDHKQQLKQALLAKKNLEAKLASLQKDMVGQKELIRIQATASFRAELADLRQQLNQREKQIAALEKQAAEILQLDSVALQETVNKQNNHIQIIESQLTEQRNSIQQLAEKNKSIVEQNQQLSRELRQRDEVIKQLSDDLQAKVLKTGKLIDENNSLNKKLGETIKKNNELTRKLDEIANTLKRKEHHQEISVNEQITILIQRMEQQAAELAGAEKIIGELQAALAETQPRLILHEKTEKEKADQVKQLQKEVQKLFNENSTLRGLLAKAESAANLLDDSLIKAELKAEAMFRYGQEQEAVALQVTKKNNELKQKLIEAEENLLILKGEQVKTDNELKNKTESLAAAKAQLDEMNSMLTAKADELGSLKNELQAQREEENIRHSELETKIVLMTESIKTLNNEIATLKTQIKDKSTALTNLELTLAEIRTTLAITEEEKATQTTRLEETLTALQEMEALKTALNEKTEALTAAQTEMNNLRNELKVKTTTISELQSKISSLALIETQLTELQASVTLLKEEKTTLTNRLEEALTTRQEMEALKVELDKKIKALTVAEAELVEMNNLRNELKNKADNLNELQNRVAALAHLESKVIDLQGSIASLGEEKSALADSLEQSKAALHAAETEKSTLRTDLSEMKAQIQPLREQLVQAERLAEESARKTDELALISKKLAEKEEEISRLQNQLYELTKKTGEIEIHHQQLDKTEINIIELNEKIKIQEQKQAAAAIKDSDKDGVPDGQDKCPDTLAETAVNNAGCEVDSDGDGVVDSLDLCPGSTPGSNVDELGCEASAKIVLTDITFATGTANLTRDAKESLNDVVRTLALHREFKLEVAGYTDSLGNINRNRSLSLQRATAVMNYLIDQGINANRLTAKGYGPANPIADNNTPEGRALNRRVELHKVLPSAEASL